MNENNADTAKEKGEKGERAISELLERELGSEYRVINDVYLAIKDDRTPLSASTQIDHVVLVSGGIFVLETKNWKRNWSGENFKSPIKQNEKHINELAKTLSEHDDDIKNKIVSLVVFTGVANLPVVSKHEEICYKKDLIKRIKSKVETKTLTKEKVDELYDAIQKNNRRVTNNTTYLKEHAEYMEFLQEKRAKKTAPEQKFTHAKSNQRKSYAKNIVVITILLILGWAVFTYLIPRLDSGKITATSAQNTPSTPTQTEVSDAVETDPFRAKFMQQLARYENEVELKIVEIRLQYWDAETHAELLKLKTNAIELFSKSEYLLAREQLTQAEALLMQAVVEYSAQFATARLDATKAFENDRAPQAEKSVQRALHLNPDDPQMQALEKRIAVMPQVLNFLQQAQVAYNENRPAKEAAALRQALSLDQSRKAAKARLKILQSQSKQQRFAAAFVAAQRALDAGDLTTAEQQVALAKTHAKTSTSINQDIQGLQKRVAQARSKRAFESQIAHGEQAKVRDDWQSAQAHFARAQQFNPGDKTASENYNLAKRITDAGGAIHDMLNAPQRLGDKNALASAVAYLRNTASLIAISPSLKKIHADLARTVDAYQTEVEVVVISDNKTYIIVRGEGQVGKTARRIIRLRPGKRVLEGTRSGYQSKLVSINIAPHVTSVEVVVVCDEKI